MNFEFSDEQKLRLLDTETPERVRLPGGQSVDVHYEADRPPWLESRRAEIERAVPPLRLPDK